ncbi:hypothetical protein F511_12951 [Dorcoceras hygrometricum]|uniref:Uncharacterized protein n=1 Tax=Dorcoceras hygrometricum TaxID=472368 RepID=A0A2Z7BGJ7_9LAMI|nr:hypothetical protein F511_12951 [Dorcoceras hygrometricum]
MGKQKVAVVRSNQLGRKPAQRSDLLCIMNKLARSSSRAKKEHNKSSSRADKKRRREQLEVKTSSDSTTADAIKSTSWCKEPHWLRSNQLSEKNR